MKSKRIGGLYWSSELLDSGAIKSVNEWKNWLADKDKNVDGWRLPSVKDFNELILNLENDEFGMFVKESLQKYWLLTKNVVEVVNLNKSIEKRALWFGSLNNRSNIYGDYYLVYISGRVFGVRDVPFTSKKSIIKGKK